MTFISLISPIFTNVRQYGALGNGSTDDSAAITAALSSLSSTGGVLFFPPGTYITTTQTLLANVHIVGAGLGNTTIKLKNGTNADLFSAQTGSINLSASLGSGSNGTLLSFSIRDLTLDGNKANQSSGTSYPLRFYGYNFILRDLQILNGYTGGALIDWNGNSFIGEPSDEMESLIDNVKFHGNSGIGLQMGGPHDSRMTNVVSFNNSSHQFHFAPNLAGLQAVNLHGYLNPNTTNVATYLIESGGSHFVNCVAEGSYYTNVVMLGNDISWIGGNIFGTATEWTNEVGIQLGQTSGHTPFPGQINQSAGVTTSVAASGCNIHAKVVNCQGGAFNFANESGNRIYAIVYQASGSAFVGTPSGTDACSIQIGGLTPDGTLGKGGVYQFPGTANNAFQVLDSSSNIDFQVSTTSTGTSGFNVPGGVEIIAGLGTAYNTGPNSTISVLIKPTNDSTTGLVIFPNSTSQSVPLFATQNRSFANVFTVDLNGNCLAQSLTVGQSASATSIANSGTITTSGVGVARVTTSGNVTGIILQAGAAGQIVTVVNESANTLTMAASGTSHVADGVSDIIAATSARRYIYDGGTSLWYKCV